MKTIVQKSMFVLLSIMLFFNMFHMRVYADYTLPYPSYMPGNKLYVLSRFLDRLKTYWYWGSIGSMKYHMELSDKYLVEAKTLFEYKQYFFAVDALRRSNREFQSLLPTLARISREGKDAFRFRQLLKDASIEHLRVLNKIISETPEVFVWKPEKQPPTELRLYELLIDSVHLRE